MNWQFITAQIIGAIILVLTVVSIQQKTKERILIFQIVANLLDSAHWFLLAALTGGIIGLINTFRCVVFFYYKKKNKKPSLSILLIFIAIAIVSGLTSWQDYYSLLPIVATIIFTYGLWQDNVSITRICTALTAASWSIYGLVFQGFTRAIGSISEAASAVISIIRYDLLSSKSFKNPSSSPPRLRLIEPHFLVFNSQLLFHPYA